MAIFEASGLHMRFGRRVVLERVDLSVEEHQFTGIIGPNGAFQIMNLFDEYSARDNVIQAMPEMRAMSWHAGHAVARDRFLDDAAEDVLHGRLGRARGYSCQRPFLWRPPRT